MRGASAVVLGAIAAIAITESTETAVANGDTRSLTLYHTHRGDTTTITFKRNGRYDAEGLKQLSYFLRDWRNDKQTRMEPRLFDIVWEVHRQVGRGGMINIVSAYRSPETNAFLRAHSHGVAKFSQHMLGRAMDFYVTGVPVSLVREAGMRLQQGGVGFYPTSGRPFTHLDAGNVRAWPRMTRAQLARLFPDGKTVHMPAEGGQMPGYQMALAELKSRGGVSVDDAYAGGGGGKSKGLFALLFGGGEGDEAAESAPTAVAAAAPGRGSSGGDDDEGGAAAAPTRVATVRVPMPMSRPADMGRAPASTPAADSTLVAAAQVPMPPIAPARPTNDVVAQANVPLPPIAPSVSSKPTPVPDAGYQLASADQPADSGPAMAWHTGAQPAAEVKAASPALALASTIPNPRPKPTGDSAVAVLAALPTPGPADDSQPREIDPKVATAYQAEAASFPRLPNAFLGKKDAAQPAEVALAYAPTAADLPATSPAKTRAAVAPQTRVTATAPADPNVRVLSPYSTPSAIYAAATVSLRRGGTLTAPEGMVTARMEGDAFRAAVNPTRADQQVDMKHPDQIHVASLMVAPSAALVGGFGSDPTHGARSDRFSGSSVMLLRTQSFAPATKNFAGGPTSSHG